MFALENEILELEENCEILQNEIDWAAVSENDLHDNMSLVHEMVKNISENITPSCVDLIVKWRNVIFRRKTLQFMFFCDFSNTGKCDEKNMCCVHG